MLSWQRLKRAKKALGELEIHIASNGLFLPPKLKSQILEIIPKLRGALISAEMNQQLRDHKMPREGGTDLAAVAPLHKAIEKAIEDRLHSHAKATAEARDRE
jgi:hypothetical protein